MTSKDDPRDERVGIPGIKYIILGRQKNTRRDSQVANIYTISENIIASTIESI